MLKILFVELYKFHDLYKLIKKYNPYLLFNFI